MEALMKPLFSKYCLLVVVMVLVFPDNHNKTACVVSIICHMKVNTRINNIDIDQ